MQRRPDLLDAPITILSIFIDSAAPATQNGVTKMSTILYHSDLDTSNRLFGFGMDCVELDWIGLDKIGNKDLRLDASWLP